MEPIDQVRALNY